MTVPSLQEHLGWPWRGRKEREPEVGDRALGSEWTCYTHVLLDTFKWDKITLWSPEPPVRTFHRKAT